jgi:hypothetical protein
MLDVRAVGSPCGGGDPWPGGLATNDVVPRLRESAARMAPFSGVLPSFAVAGWGTLTGASLSS